VVGLAQAGSHPSLAIADDDDSTEAEAAASLDDLRDAVNENDALAELAIAAVAPVPISTSEFCHVPLPC
jgi:hypothetical protein